MIQEIKSYITYTQADLFYMGLLKNVCGQYSMRGMDEKFLMKKTA